MVVGDFEATWVELAEKAWAVRENACAHGPTRVGAAVLASDGSVFVGCNVEHRFRSHDVHAEVNALSGMIAAGRRDARAIVIAAERDHFTPCGACLDWIFELGGPDCLVAFQGVRGGEVAARRADELMPYNPR